MDCPRLDCPHHDFVGHSCNLDGLYSNKESVLSIASFAGRGRGRIFSGYYRLSQPLVSLPGSGQSSCTLYGSTTSLSFHWFTYFRFTLEGKLVRGAGMAMAIHR